MAATQAPSRGATLRAEDMGPLKGATLRSMEAVDMNGTIAQVVALTIYGNHSLQTGDAFELFSENAVFRFCRSVSSQGPAEDLHTTIEALARLLQGLVLFARRHELTGFAGCFWAGIEALSDPTPLAKVYHSDIAPLGYLSREAQALLAAAHAAWVFGGMGSWNDLGFAGDDQKIYDSLSQQII